MKTIAELRKERGVAFDAYKILADKETLTEDELKEYDDKKRAVEALDAQIKRAKEVQDLDRESLRLVDDQDDSPVRRGDRRTSYATPETDPYVNDEAARKLARNRGYLEGSARTVVMGGVIQMTAAANGSLHLARQISAEVYGENHPVTRALIVSEGASGGFIVPPDYMAEIIELLRPQAVVRGSGPRQIPMPRGTMTIPGQASAATATYGGEVVKITESSQGLNQIVATYKKLKALVPVSNDLMRFADPAVDAFVRDDLVKVMALREDLAFILGDGTQDSPEGFLTFANAPATTKGVFNEAANSTAAVGANFITSAASYTVDTAADELGLMDNVLDTANVPARKRVWFMHPRTKNFLFNARNSLSIYMWRDEMTRGTLNGHPFKVTTQIPIDYYNTDGSHTDCSFLFLVEMDEALLFDSMQLELAVSREGTYVNGAGNTISAFQTDQTLIRAIAEHDFHMRHNASVAVDQFVRWAP